VSPAFGDYRSVK
jgi:hypothetical protein